MSVVLCLGLLWFMLAVGLEFWDGTQKSVSYMLEVILASVAIEGRAVHSSHGSHFDWKTWKNERAFSSQGKFREF